MQYSGSDVLYVPVTQLDLLSRYTAPGDEEKVKLAKLGGAEWQRTRAKVKKATEEMAQELIELYARRRQATGYAFPPDGDWQRDFETRFDYDETDDQLNATAEIKQDMEKPWPDGPPAVRRRGRGQDRSCPARRLQVRDGRQAVRHPGPHHHSGVAALQHHFLPHGGLPRKWDALPLPHRQNSRKRPSGACRRARGHRGGHPPPAFEDVKFKDLGLVIIDEEQRFGVKHKEKLKENFIGVDMLTLSATPIPRTLNMAMSGIRDMSTIEAAAHRAPARGDLCAGIRRA